MILSVKNLSLSYNINNFKMSSVRDFFIQMIQSPVRFIFRRPVKLEVLNDISFSIKKGEIVGLVGINGAGKTSLCRLITGMYGKKDEIQVEGILRAIFDTGTVMHPELSGEENAWIITNIIYSTLSKAERSEIVDEALHFAGLDEFIHAPFKTYSKGMKTRLFLSIISAKPCDLLILDEVFNGADAFFNAKISKRILKVIKDSGSVIFISHEEDLVKEICNRVIILGDKKILFDGDVDKGFELYRKKYSGYLEYEL
jgi:ABC-type polysaccharide/polyol phosphate transport system ATPase subunit